MVQGQWLRSSFSRIRHFATSYFSDLSILTQVIFRKYLIEFPAHTPSLPSESLLYRVVFWGITPLIKTYPCALFPIFKGTAVSPLKINGHYDK